MLVGRRRWWVFVAACACADDAPSAGTETGSSSTTVGASGTSSNGTTTDATTATGSTGTPADSTGTSGTGTSAATTTTDSDGSSSGSTTGGSSSDTSGDSSSSTGDPPPPACVLPDETSESGEDPPLDLGDEGGCGNGVVEGDEHCDDGNAIPGDGCEIDCTLSDDVQPEFQFGLGGPTGFPDCGTGVAFDSEGSLILGAYSEEQIWLRKYDVDYEEQWTVTYPGKPGGGSCYVKVAVDSEDNIAFAGPTGVLDNADWLFGLLDPEGTEIWTDTMDGPIQRHDFREASRSTARTTSSSSACARTPSTRAKPRS